FIPLQVELGARQLRLVLLLRRLRLLQRSLVRARIDLKEGVSRLDVLAFLEVDFYDLAVNPALDGNHIVRLDRADPLQEYRNVGGGDSAGGDRGRLRRGLRRRRGGLAAQAQPRD